MDQTDPTHVDANRKLQSENAAQAANNRGQKMSQNITSALGFEFLQEAEKLQHRILSGGPAALISLAKALIWSRSATEDFLVDEMCVLTGDHMEEVIRTILMEGENIHWLRKPRGFLTLPIDYQ